MKYATTIKLGVLAVFLSNSMVWGAEAPALIEFVRPLGMGGAFTAIADDQNIFNYNPAGMVQRTGGQFTLLEIAVGASDDTKDAMDFISDNKEKLDQDFNTLPANEQQTIINDITNNISKLDPRIYVAADIASYVSGPRFLGLPFHVGYGAFGAEDFSFRLDQAAGVPNVSYSSNADIVLPLAIAKRFETRFGNLGVGLTGKYIRRIQIKQDRISVLQLEDIETPPTIDGNGIGADVGLLYQPNDRLNVGLMVQDAGGTKMKFDEVLAENGFPGQAERESVIRSRTNIGVAVIPKKLLWLIPTSDRWTFAADIKDIMQKDDHVLFENGLRKVVGENFGTHAHLGAEFRWWFLRFRGGASQGYPTFGLGLDIPVLKLDYAFYSKELGRLAGDRRQENHIISLAFRFGAGHTESRERIAKKKESNNQKDLATPETMGQEEVPQSESASPSAPTNSQPAETSPQPTESIPQ